MGRPCLSNAALTSPYVDAAFSLKGYNVFPFQGNGDER